jgi:hypothetical protein
VLDADKTTVLFDFHDPTGAANPGTVSTKLGPGWTSDRSSPTSWRSARPLAARGAAMLASSLRAAGRLPGERSARLP